MFHATRHELLMYVVGQGIEEAVKSRLTAWNVKDYFGAHSCLRHVAVVLQINTNCFSRTYFDLILSLFPYFPLFSLSLKFSDLNDCKLTLLCELRVHLVLPQIIIPERYQYKS